MTDNSSIKYQILRHYNLLLKNAAKTTKFYRAVEVELTGHEFLTKQSVEGKMNSLNLGPNFPAFISDSDPEKEEDEIEPEIGDFQQPTFEGFQQPMFEENPQESPQPTTSSDNGIVNFVQENINTASEQESVLNVYTNLKGQKYISTQELDPKIAQTHPMTCKLSKIPAMIKMTIKVTPSSQEIKIGFKITRKIYTITLFKVFCYIHQDIKRKANWGETNDLTTECNLPKTGASAEASGTLTIKVNQLPKTNQRLIFFAIRSYAGRVNAHDYSLPFALNIGHTDERVYECDYLEMMK